MNRASTEEVLNRAYRLAYFLHQDRGIATRIVADATLKLNVAMAVQSKRLYYVPVGRFSRGESRRTDGIRSKALFSDLHLLQRLLYVESESYERQKERAASAAPPSVRTDSAAATKEDLLVYFIKHLVRITTKRNAFYVTLGVSRLLHSYSTLETMEIYNAVIGEPERVKDDYYYRSRKAVLMHEMSQRFGALIRACRQRRGEERFETQQGTNEQRSLVRECLRLFTPWDTQCHVPRDFDPLKSVITALISRSNADENEIEVNRIHAVLHPECFERLVAAFGYSEPAERMELPRFFLDQMDDQSPPNQRSAPTDLSAEELAEIGQMLGEQSGRRRRASPTAVIRIMIDGVERGRLNPAEQSSITFSAEPNAEIVEVKTMDQRGDLLLATCLLTSVEKEATDEAVVSSIQLEGGQELSLSIARIRNANGDAELRFKFGYQETHLRRAARLWWQRFTFRRAPEEALNPSGLWGGRSVTARYILAGSVVVICLIASYLAYVRLTSRDTVGPTPTSEVAINSPGAAAPNGPDEAQPKATTSAPEQIVSQPTRRTTSDKSTAASVPDSTSADVSPQTDDEDLAANATRSGNVVPNLALREVKKIYVDTAVSDLQKSLVDSLRSSGVVGATTNADEADASLKIVVLKTSAGETQIEVSVQLVNARGVVLWPKAGRTRRYSGETTTVIPEIVRDLVSDMRRAHQ